MGVKLPKVPCFGRNIKLWGWTQTVALSETNHTAVAYLQKGGYSSKHHHKNLWNRFVVVDGTLRITIYRNDREEVTDLHAGDILDVDPGVWHKMAAVTDARIVEIYWPVEGVLDPEDIVREDNGGIQPQNIMIPTLFGPTLMGDTLPVYDYYPIQERQSDEIHNNSSPLRVVTPTAEVVNQNYDPS
jgi:mannose-6-phosphate isomerase-like protein (cupin superfamily)